MANYDIQGARQAGVSDADIAASLAPRLNYDLEGARKAGIADKDIADALANKFNSTPSGAAVGNPNIQKQGDSLLRGGNLNPIWDIGGATVAGGLLGAASKEILTGAGNVIGSYPYPFTRTVGGFLKGAGQAIGNAGRGVAATSGAVSGAAGETAGQVADMVAPNSRLVQEGTRLVAGAISPDTARALGGVARHIWALSSSPEKKITKEVADAIIKKLESGETRNFSEEELKYVEQLKNELRLGAPKSNDPLESTGSLMGGYGRSIMSDAERKLLDAQAAAAGGQIKPGAEVSDIGDALRGQITKQQDAAMRARAAEFGKNQEAVQSVVDLKERAGKFVSDTAEYKTIIAMLEAQLDNSVAMQRSPDVQNSLRKMLTELTNAEKSAAEKKLTLSGQNLDWVETPGKAKSVSFQAIDDVRRKLGEVFKGKPSEGYEALKDTEIGKALYSQLRDLQVKYAGPPQESLLSAYHAGSQELQQFQTKLGKKATALDQWMEGHYGTDAAALPASFFKTKASMQALRELTGNQALVNTAALQYADRQLAGKDAAGVRKWLADNTEWLSQAGNARVLIDNYASKLEGLERNVRIAEEFASKASANKNLLVGKGIPANQAVALIESKNAAFWDAAMPAITASPQAKTDTLNAVRQVVANKATTHGIEDLFELSIRPFLEKGGIASKAEMDFMAKKLAEIRELKVPEEAKLGMWKRLILNAAGGWSATIAGRGTTWAKDKVIPE